MGVSFKQFNGSMSFRESIARMSVAGGLNKAKNEE